MTTTATAKIFGAPATRPTRFRRADEVMSEPAPVAIIQDTLWAGCVTALVATSGSGKTFAQLSMAAAISRGRGWLGRRVTPGSVAYCSFEGDALGVRLRAIVEDSGDELEHVYVLRQHDPISPHVSRDGIEAPSLGELALCQDIDGLSAQLAEQRRPPIVLIVIDTVRASMTGSEDSSESVSAYLRAVRRILERAPGAAALLSHHAGWQDGDDPKKRERGSSAWRGNVDGTLFLDVEDDSDRDAVRLVLRTMKARDCERAAPLRMVRRCVRLSLTSPDGRPVYSCVIDEARVDAPDAVEDRLAGAQLAIDMRVLGVLVEHPALASQEAIRGMAGISRTDAYAALDRLTRRGWVQPPGKQRQPYRTTDDGLVAYHTSRTA